MSNKTIVQPTKKENPSQDSLFNILNNLLSYLTAPIFASMLRVA